MGPMTSLRPKPSPGVLLDAARRELSDEILRGEGGSAALERYSSRLDALILQLAADAPPAGRRVVDCRARRLRASALCLHSDIDLLVVFDGQLGEQDELFLRALLHPLWDAGLVVGHQVRELDELARLEVDNPEFLLALVDARHIAGDSELFSQFQEAFHSPQTHAFIVDALERLIDERHAQFNGTLYQLEPDVKDAPGALRDLTAVRTLAILTDPSLMRQGPEDPERLLDAEDFYLRIRSVLHLETRRNHNLLTHALQERVADVLGYPGPLPQPRVERLMGDYFRHARVVTRALEWAPAIGPTAGRCQCRSRRRRHPLHRPRKGSRPARDVAGRLPGRPRRGLSRVERRAGLHAPERRAVLDAPISFLRRHTAWRCCGS